MTMLLSVLNFLMFIALTTSFVGIDVFKAGSGGYACYRIPSILITTNGTLIAFAEGRKYSCGDHGYVDIVYKRSFDSGKTWSSLSILYSNSTSKTVYHTIGNPSPVEDKNNGKIWILFCKDNKQIYSSFSIDNGNTWSLPPKQLNTINNPNWNWVATGPPSGLQIINNNNNNNISRLIFPIDWSIPNMYSTKGYIVYSDDSGNSWQISKEFGGNNYWPNESQAVQLNNGSIFINSRTGKNDSWYRLGSISNDAGNSFIDTNYIKQLRDTEGGCEGSMIMASNGNIYYSGLTPSAITANRINMTLHFSKDQGNSWQFMTVIEPGSSAYSSLVEIKSKNSIAVLYGRDNQKYISFDTYSI
eukprot:140189_1